MRPSMLFVLPFLRACLLVGCAAPPSAPPTSGTAPSTAPSPAIAFRGLVHRPESEYEPPYPVAEFRVTNPGPGSLWYAAHGPGDPVRATAADRVGGTWRDRPMVFSCGFGLRSVELPPGGHVDFEVRLEDGAEAIRPSVSFAAVENGDAADYRSGEVETAGWVPAAPPIVVPAAPRDREAALLHAARIGYEAKVRVLLDAGTPPDCRPGRPDGRTPLAYPGGGWASVECNRTPLHAAADRGHAGVVAMLVAAGADVDADDGCGGTPLVYAAHAGYSGEAVARALLAAGANPTPVLWLPDIPRGREGVGVRETPLHTAVSTYGRETGLALALIAGGADVNAPDGWDRTPLDLALKDAERKADVVAALRAAGGRPGRADRPVPAGGFRE